MKTTINRPMAWASVLCALALAGCDSVKDVSTVPATDLGLKEKVSLKGVINGLGGGRNITLTYNGVFADGISVLGSDPAEPTTAPASVPFTFGALDEGIAYDVVVAVQPYSKECAPVSGNKGTLTKGQEVNVVINCAPSLPRDDLVVTLPADPALFSGLPGARVRVYTGEQMHEQAVKPGQTEVRFVGALYNTPMLIPPPPAVPNPNNLEAAPLNWAVSASFFDAEGRENRCRVNNWQGFNPPVGGISNVSVAGTATAPPCQFTMSGSVAYSTPPGGTADPAGAFPGCDVNDPQDDPDCLLLEVRDVTGTLKASYAVTGYGAFTVGGAATPALFHSNEDATFDVKVARHPTGRTCVVGDGGAASLYRSGVSTPVDITATAAPGAVRAFGGPATRAWGSRLNVFCRKRPEVEGKQPLVGTYRLTRSTWTPAPTVDVPNPTPRTVRYDQYDWTVQNLGSSDMLTFFDDGTFLYGSHAFTGGTFTDSTFALTLSNEPYSVQVEHGFYEYTDPDNDPDTDDGTLRFTLITDTNPLSAFPASWGPIEGGVVYTASRTGTPGLSATPGPIVNGTPVAGAGVGIWTAALNKVRKSTVTFTEGRSKDAPQTLGRITGTFGTATTLDWELTEPQSLAGEMTGTWVSRDHRRFWVWDYLTYYGTHVGVTGGAPSMNDSCFTTPEVDASYGLYTRRQPQFLVVACYPFNRPQRENPVYASSSVESVDFYLTNPVPTTNTFVGVAPLAPLPSAAFQNPLAGSRLVPQFGTEALAVLPGFAGRIPGGQAVSDGRSPSPSLFLIAPAASFASKVASTNYDQIGPASTFFDDFDPVTGPFPGCPTEILAIRGTQNGRPIDRPVYFCRTRAP